MFNKHTPLVLNNITNNQLFQVDADGFFMSAILYPRLQWVNHDQTFYNSFKIFDFSEANKKNWVGGKIIGSVGLQETNLFFRPYPLVANFVDH